MTFPYSVGASTVLWPGRPTPEVVFDQIERYRPTIFFAVPTIYVPMLALPGAEQRDLRSLRLCLSAAEALPPKVYHHWRERYGLEIIEGLGSTEVLHVYISNYSGRAKPGSSGTLVPGYAIALRDPDGNLVPPGETGAMLVRGDSSAPCYWNRPDKSAHTMRSDWIYTGDLFAQDADGYFHFNGRADEMMKVAGQWVSPVEVELALNKHPAVKECAVIPTRDAAGLMTSKACIVVHDTHAVSATLAKELQDFVKGQIAPYKDPRMVEFVADLPKTGTDKINRLALRA
jgi:acyl-coenzyme A synthetase/AMP-(fatty) acid ligase